jgi:competence protein CoiA
MRDCDTWAEKETDWHRAWKNNFPAECQEFIRHDGQSGEKHIADVRTPHGLVIEFQHSHLDPLERAARERFYGNMVWVVDGTRLQRDYPRFNRGKDDLRRTNIQGQFLLAFPDDCFPAMWLDSSVPVIFDFRSVDKGQPPDEFRDTLSRTCGRKCCGCWNVPRAICKGGSKPSSVASRSRDPNAF